MSLIQEARRELENSIYPLNYLEVRETVRDIHSLARNDNLLKIHYFELLGSGMGLSPREFEVKFSDIDVYVVASISYLNLILQGEVMRFPNRMNDQYDIHEEPFFMEIFPELSQMEGFQNVFNLIYKEAVKCVRLNPSGYSEFSYSLFDQLSLDIDQAYYLMGMIHKVMQKNYFSKRINENEQIISEAGVRYLSYNDGLVGFHKITNADFRAKVVESYLAQERMLPGTCVDNVVNFLDVLFHDWYNPFPIDRYARSQIMESPLRMNASRYSYPFKAPGVKRLTHHLGIVPGLIEATVYSLNKWQYMRESYPETNLAQPPLLKIRAFRDSLGDGLPANSGGNRRLDVQELHSFLVDLLNNWQSRMYSTCGVRDEEVQYLPYIDFDFKIKSMTRDEFYRLHTECLQNHGVSIGIFNWPVLDLETAKNWDFPRHIVMTVGEDEKNYYVIDGAHKNYQILIDGKQLPVESDAFLYFGNSNLDYFLRRRLFNNIIPKHNFYDALYDGQFFTVESKPLERKNMDLLPLDMLAGDFRGNDNFQYFAFSDMRALLDGNNHAWSTKKSPFRLSIFRDYDRELDPELAGFLVYDYNSPHYRVDHRMTQSYQERDQITTYGCVRGMVQLTKVIEKEAQVELILDPSFENTHEMVERILAVCRLSGYQVVNIAGADFPENLVRALQKHQFYFDTANNNWRWRDVEVMNATHDVRSRLEQLTNDNVNGALSGDALHDMVRLQLEQGFKKATQLNHPHMQSFVQAWQNELLKKYRTLIIDSAGSVASGLVKSWPGNLFSALYYTYRFRGFDDMTLLNTVEEAGWLEIFNQLFNDKVSRNIFLKNLWKPPSIIFPERSKCLQILLPFHFPDQLINGIDVGCGLFPFGSLNSASSLDFSEFRLPDGISPQTVKFDFGLGIDSQSDYNWAVSGSWPGVPRANYVRNIDEAFHNFRCQYPRLDFIVADIFDRDSYFPTIANRLGEGKMFDFAFTSFVRHQIGAGYEQQLRFFQVVDSLVRDGGFLIDIGEELIQRKVANHNRFGVHVYAKRDGKFTFIGSPLFINNSGVITEVDPSYFSQLNRDTCLK